MTRPLAYVLVGTALFVVLIAVGPDLIGVPDVGGQGDPDRAVARRLDAGPFILGVMSAFVVLATGWEAIRRRKSKAPEVP
jgi:hypothetical protein